MNHEDFVKAYCEIWSQTLGFETLWHPDGVLDHPTLSKPIAGRYVPTLNEYNRALLPDLEWRCLNWAGREETVFIEWECAATLNGEKLYWRGVDKFELRDQKIQKETVYSDTMPLWRAVDPSLGRPALVDADQLIASADGAS